MEVLLAICAESALLDQQSNKLSLLGIAEDVSVPAFPGVINSLAFVLVMGRKKTEPEEFHFRLTIEMNGKKFFENPVKMSFQRKLRSRAIINLQGIPIQSAGEMTFIAKQDDKVLGTWVVQVGDALPVIAPPVLVKPALAKPAVSTAALLPEVAKLAKGGTKSREKLPGKKAAGGKKKARS